MAPARENHYGQAKIAIDDLQEYVNCVRTQITNGRYRAAAWYPDKMQRCLNRLRSSIEHLSGLSRNKWRIKDNLVGWQELMWGLISGWLSALLAFHVPRKYGIGLFVVEFGILAYLVWKGPRSK
jgi:hypothetical protein